MLCVVGAHVNGCMCVCGCEWLCLRVWCGVVRVVRAARVVPKQGLIVGDSASVVLWLLLSLLCALLYVVCVRVLVCGVGMCVCYCVVVSVTVCVLCAGECVQALLLCVCAHACVCVCVSMPVVWGVVWCASFCVCV